MQEDRRQKVLVQEASRVRAFSPDRRMIMSLKLSKGNIQVSCDGDGCKKVRVRGMPPSWGSVILYIPSSSARSVTFHVCSTRCAERLFAKLAESVTSFKKALAKKPKPKPKKAVV